MHDPEDPRSSYPGARSTGVPDGLLRAPGNGGHAAHRTATVHGTTVHCPDVVTSTQDHAADLWRAGEPTPFAVLAREQVAGRGRLGRSFVTPPGGGLAITVAIRTDLPVAARSWFPLAAGLAVIDALCGPSLDLAPARRGPGGTVGEVGLKWPNDIHTSDGRKLGGILVEGHGADGVLVGIGLNLRGPVRDAGGAEVPGAAWLLGPGSLTGRVDTPAAVEQLRRALAGELLAGVLREVRILGSTGGDARESGTLDRYTVTCLTLGRRVQVEPLGATSTPVAPSGASGTAQAIDDRGRLVLRTAEGALVPVDVGDVRHGPRESGRHATIRNAGEGAEGPTR